MATFMPPRCMKVAMLQRAHPAAGSELRQGRRPVHPVPVVEPEVGTLAPVQLGVALHPVAVELDAEPGAGRDVQTPVGVVRRGPAEAVDDALSKASRPSAAGESA